jgi:hypothetical protein
MNRLLSILNIEFLIKENAFKNWRMILFISALALVMIGSGHVADRKIFEIAELNTKIKVLKSDFVAIKKELLVLKKESTVTEALRAKGIGPAGTPPIKINIIND